MASPAPLPLPVPPERVPEGPRASPAAPEPQRPRQPGLALTLGLCLVAAAVTAVSVWALSNRSPAASGAFQQASVRTGVASAGDLIKSLRVGGTVETLNYASIRAPRMRGPRDSGRADLTLAMLAEPGTVVEAGTQVAEFELKWLEDHIVDRQSVVLTAQSNFRKREADILILKETERQGRLNARAEFDKATLDVRTAEVRSEIEAEILRNMADEKHVTWQQLDQEGRLMERVHTADLRSEELTVREEVLHVERHERDYERLQVKTPIGGMIVLESRLNKSGQFAQTKAGDQVYPGALIMRVVDVSQMVVSAAVNQVDAQAIRIGNRAIIELDAYPGARFEGRVVDMGAMATTGGGGGKTSFSRGSTGKFVKHIEVRILIDEADERILPDLSASVDVLLSGSDSGLLVPREAVRRDPGSEGEYVYVRDGESFRRQRIGIRDSNDTHALVEQGLQDGDEILLSAVPPDGTDESL